MINRWSRPVLLLLVLMVGAIPARASGQDRGFTISVGDGGWGQVQLGGLLEDGGLIAALESGLPLRVHLRLELWRKQLFDRLVDASTFDLALLQDPLDGSYRLADGRSVSVHRELRAAAAALAAAIKPQIRPSAPGRYYYLGVLEVETLSLSDVEELRRWLRGEVQPAVEGRSSPARAVERGLGRLFVRVIGIPSRKYEARSRTFIVPERSQP